MKRPNTVTLRIKLPVFVGSEADIDRLDYQSDRELVVSADVWGKAIALASLYGFRPPHTPVHWSRTSVVELTNCLRRALTEEPPQSKVLPRYAQFSTTANSRDFFVANKKHYNTLVRIIDFLETSGDLEVCR